MTYRSINSAVDELASIFDAASNSQEQVKPKKRRRRKQPVLSVRMSIEERARLEREAAGMSVSEYVRTRLFAESAKPRRTRGKFPVKDHEALSRVLGKLGRSEMAEDFSKLAWAFDNGVINLDPDAEFAVRRACADIAAMRADLIKALGLR